jgi:hypothetical protein
MASSTDIANSALMRLGAARVTDIADTTSENAKVMNAQYPIARDLLMRSFRWSFAMKRDSLPADADAPAWGFDRRFLLPVDYLHIDLVGEIYVGGDMSDYRDSDLADFQIEGRYILTNLDTPLPIRYIARVTDAGLFDPHFVEALSMKLAVDCCEKVTGSTSKKESLKGDLRDAIRNAVRANAIEKPPQPVPDESWIIARL